MLTLGFCEGKCISALVRLLSYMNLLLLAKTMRICATQKEKVRHETQAMRTFHHKR